MIEHWYQYLPAAWLTDEGKWYVIISILLLMALSFLLGLYIGHHFGNPKPKEPSRTIKFK